MESLNAFTRRNFSESQHNLFKAGLIDQNGQPTSRGKEELSALLWDKHTKELEKVADEINEVK